jgi:SAM-dependent methyltransferase
MDNANARGKSRPPTFTITRGGREQGVVVGNLYDKYGSRNPLVQRLMNGFRTSLESLVERTEANEIHEVGCGEGFWTLRWLHRGLRARGSDFSTQAIELARVNAKRQGIPPQFAVANIYDLIPERDAAELIVCCEVLEHLEKPELALRVLKVLAKAHLIISVPREPIWRILNVARGAHWAALGNTPGHLQHWSRESFVELVSQEFAILEVLSPLPWSMILAAPRKSDWEGKYG